MTGAVAVAVYAKDGQASVVGNLAMSTESFTEKGIPNSGGSGFD
jgi:hypothetical protein